jgi:hypothetical protein
VIVNRGANTLNVYPATGGQIDSAGTNTAITLPVNGTITLQASSTTQWYSVNPVVVGSTNISVAYGNGQTSISATGLLTALANQGGGAEVFNNITGTTANLRTLVGTANGLTVTQNPTTITIDNTLTGSNLGGGTGVFSAKSGATLQFNTFAVGTGGLSISGPTANLITLDNTLTGANLGAGSQVFANKSGSTLNFRSITAGTGVSVTQNINDISIANTGVLSFSAGTTGFTPNTATTGTVTLAGTLNVANGGTGLSTTPTNGQLLIGNGTNYTLSTLTAGTGIGIANGAGSITVSNTGVTSITGTTNQVAVSASTGAVTVSTPSTFIAPGTIQDTTGMLYSTNATVTAAGATQGTATALTRSYNVVTTVASGTGVSLPPPSAAGLRVVIVNRGANTLNVYPATGGQIDAAGTNTAITLPVNATITLQASSTTQWYSVDPYISAGSGITVTYGNGATTIAASGSSSQSLTVSAIQLTVSSTSVSTPYYFAWNNARFGSFTTRQVSLWVVPGDTARNLTVSVVNNGGPTIGTTTINGGSATGLYTFTFTAPGANTRLDFTVVRSAGAGTNPVIFGINIDLI